MRISGHTYACAPSVRAMKGSRPQSFSVAGSLPSSAPNHVSISGPLYPLSTLFLRPDPADALVRRPRARTVLLFHECLGTHLAWWKSTTHTSGSSAAMVIVALCEGAERLVVECSRIHGKARVLTLRDAIEDAVTKVQAASFSPTELGCLQVGASASQDVDWEISRPKYSKSLIHKRV
jgi:hypothetical protein